MIGNYRSKKTLVAGKAKTAIAEFSYSGVMYKETLQQKFGQPYAFVGAQLDKWSSFSPLWMHKLEIVKKSPLSYLAWYSFQFIVIQQ